MIRTKGVEKQFTEEFKMWKGQLTLLLAALPPTADYT